MKILLKNQELSPVRTGGRSFFHYTVNNDNVFQQYLNIDLFEKQMGVGKGKGLVIYEHPARIVAGAIADGDYDNAPLQKWIDESEESLAVIRRYRRSTLVIERDATDEQYFKSAFSAAFAGRQPPQELASQEHESQKLTLLIAFLAVRQYAPTAQRLAELEASSLAPTGELPFDDTLRIAAKELYDLLEKAQASTAQAERLEAENRDLAQKNHELNQATQSHEKETNEILMRQVLDLESGLRQADLTRRKAEERTVEAERKHQSAAKEVAELKTAIDLIRGSTSWRLTAPVRAIKSAFSR